MEPGGLCSARAMSLMDSPAFHRFHSSFLPAADNPLGRPSLATLAPPIRTTPKTLPCCTDRLNPPGVYLRSDEPPNGEAVGPRMRLFRQFLRTVPSETGYRVSGTFVLRY